MPYPPKTITVEYDYYQEVKYTSFPTYSFRVVGARPSAYPGRTDYLLRSRDGSDIWVDQSLVAVSV